ncbi:MAG TPA: HAMP domain-containing sensor histidine kinase [Gammaproteobacteria bacterium]
MTLRRDPSKALQVGFLLLLVVSIAQVAYWVSDYLLYARDVERRIAARYEAEAKTAEALLRRGFTPAELRELMPEIDIAGDDAQVTPAVLAELAAERARRTNRYLWEGGFFLAVLLAGLTVLTRTIRHDAELRRRQQNFLAAVSHEFKSPLASVRLAAETLVLRAKDPDSRKLGQRILDDGERLLRMVENLLETTRLEEGRHTLSPAPLDLRAAAEAAAAEMKDRAGAHGVAVRVDVPAGLELNVDRTALETALRNLLDNALKACIAGHGRAIEVAARRTAEGVELAVRDDGLGLPPEEAAMIFEKFYRLGDELKRTTPGTGLGLYIVKRLVELSGGRVTAASDGPGRGATVKILWPERRAA